MNRILRRIATVSVLVAFGLAVARGAGLAEGSVIDLAGQKVTILKIDALPFVQSDYTRRFHFDSAENPKLKELREKYKLDEVVLPGRDEFDQQVLLMDWVHKRFKRFGQPSTSAKGALEILRDIKAGQRFFCAQYAQVMVSTAASLGWVDRELALRRHQGVNAHGGSTEHSTTEIWSNEYGKWVMLDPTSDMYLEKEGKPLDAWEIRQEWFYHEGKDLVFVIGKERRRYRKSDLPIYLEHFAEFGDLTVDPDEPDKYGFIGYIPNTNLMDAGEDYGKMFITKDQLCSGTKWHIRVNPAHPATDPYFPIDQAALEIQPGTDGLKVDLKTLTPNFERFEARRDEGAWEKTGESVQWKLHPGKNFFEARAVNAFGVRGPISRAEVEVAR